MQRGFKETIFWRILVEAMLTLLSKTGGIEAYRVSSAALMVLCTLALPSTAVAKRPGTWIFWPCVCSPNLTASQPTPVVRLIANRRMIMQTVSQPENTQEINHDVNGLELNILNIDSISITHHIRSDYGDLEDLQKSLRKDGIQDPLLVYEIEAGKYAVIDGVRRLKAVQEMGMKQVSCLIKSGIKEADAAHLAYVKNHERKSLSPMEEARHILRMKEEFGFTHDELEIKGYGSPAKISQTLKLLGIAEPVQAMIDTGELTKEHGIKLSKLPSANEQERIANQIVKSNWSASKAEEKVSDYLKKGKKTKRHIPDSIIPAGKVPGVYFKDSSDMGELPSRCAHFICTSPPYLAGKEFEKGIDLKEHIQNVSAVMAECARVLVPGGVMAVNVGDIYNYRGENEFDLKPNFTMMGHRYQSLLKRGKVHLHNVIIWRKQPAWTKAQIRLNENTEHTTYRFFLNWEPIYIFRKEGVRSLPEAEDVVMRSKITQEQFKKWSEGTKLGRH